MDTFRGYFSSDADYGDDAAYLERGEEETGHDGPPDSIGRDERRMQVRAYNHWASLLGDRNFPCIEDLDPENLPDFGPYSVLLDFTSGIENPGIAYLGDMLATECGAQDEIAQLSDVPSRSLLSRITDHYMQILANQAPIGFEAEFVNQLGKSIAYRGILLPFSTDDDSIDFIYGVINWKEGAPVEIAARLATEVETALAAVPVRKDHVPVWADGPSADALELAVVGTRPGCLRRDLDADQHLLRLQDGALDAGEETPRTAPCAPHLARRPAPWRASTADRGPCRRTARR